MRFIYNQELNERIAPYFEKLIEKKSSQPPVTVTLFDILMEYLDLDSRYCSFNDRLEPCIKQIIREENIKSAANLFDGKFNKLLHYILGDEYASLFQTYLKLKARCPYINENSHQSQRSVNPMLHYSHVMEVLIQFIKLRAIGFSDQLILNGGSDPKEIEAYKDAMDCQYWMAAKIEQGDETVINYLHNALTDNSNTNHLHRAYFQAIAISGYLPLLELVGNLLATPRLPESVRQAILETMHEGCPESFCHLYSIICNSNLQRMSSVKRIIAGCVGLGEHGNSELITTKHIELILRFLNEQELARHAIHSKNNMELYLALWSIGFYNIDLIDSLAIEIIRKGNKEQVQVLLHFLRNTNSGMNHHISKEAFEVWHNEPSVVATTLPLYLGDLYLSHYSSAKDTPALSDYYNSKEEAIRHYKYLRKIYQLISDKSTLTSYSSIWKSTQISYSDIITKMAYITWMTNDTSLKDDLCIFLPTLDSYTRIAYISVILNPPTSPSQEEYILQSLGDRSIDVRDEAFKILNELTLSSEQIQKIEELLRLKYSEMRINAINLLLKQPKAQLAESIRRLVTDKIAERRLAGLDMMKTIYTVESMQDIYQDLLPVIQKIQHPSAKEKVLIASLVGDGTSKNSLQNYTKDNGFGLYDLDLEVDLPDVLLDPGFSVEATFDFILSGQAKHLFEKLNKYIESNKEQEFKSTYGETRRIEDTVLVNWTNDSGLSGLGLPEVWQAFYEQEIGSYTKLLMMSFMLASTGSTKDEEEYLEEDEEDKKADRISSLSFERLVDQMYAGITYRELQRGLCKLPYYNQIEEIINALLCEYCDEIAYQQISTNMLLRLLPLLNTQNVFRQYINKHAWLDDKQEYGKRLIVYPIQDNRFVQFWLKQPQDPMDDATFVRYFTVRYKLYKLVNYMEHTPEVEEPCAYLRGMDFARAWLLRMIPEDEVYRELTGRISSPCQIEDVTQTLFDAYRPNWDRREADDMREIDFSSFLPLIKKVLDRILEIELQRGDSETEVTHLAKAIRRIYGSNVLIRILQALGKDTFIRENHNWDSSKRNILSGLLRVCHPSPDDTSENLKKEIKEAQISDEKMVEVAMFVPEWIELTEKAIEWEGFASTAYYFHAHTNDACDDRKKAVIARYTPINIEDLRHGAFDIGWFREAYKTIGKQRFEVVYNAAKYISGTNSHGRARKFADAANGIIKIENIKREIIAKRNKDLLMSYGLIPLGKNPDKELLERYQFLQDFLKKSKESNAQKLESERKTVNIALQNLARNSGYGDIIRLTWSMETELIKDILPYLSPKEIEGIEVFIHIDVKGKAEIKLLKAGKEINSMPAKLKKHPYIGELKEVHKRLSDLYTQSCLMLEQAMEQCIRFKESEIRKLIQNPVIWPLLEHLVFTSNEQTGFYCKQQLITIEGAHLDLKPNDELRIVHPSDLHKGGNWLAYQKLLDKKSTYQPFKQVFREFYTPTAEEKEAMLSYRYTGNLVHPQKAISKLKERRWMANDENGLQKIYYKENIIATISAMTDCFFQAEIKNATLEHICFYDRKEYKPMKISEVPPVIFSEVMRDVALAVEE